jgi:hypothetical protein
VVAAVPIFQACLESTYNTLVASGDIPTMLDASNSFSIHFLHALKAVKKKRAKCLSFQKNLATRQLAISPDVAVHCFLKFAAHNVDNIDQKLVEVPW